MLCICMNSILETTRYKEHRKKLKQLEAKGITFRCASKQETAELAKAFVAVACLDNRPEASDGVLKIGIQAMRNAGKTTFIKEMIQASDRKYKAAQILTKIYNIQCETEHLGVVNTIDYAECRNDELSPDAFGMLEASLIDTFGEEEVEKYFSSGDDDLNAFERALKQPNRPPGIDIVEHIDRVPDEELFPEVFITIKCEKDPSIIGCMPTAISESFRYVTIYCNDNLQQTDGYKEFHEKAQHLRL